MLLAWSVPFRPAGVTTVGGSAASKLLSHWHRAFIKSMAASQQLRGARGAEQHGVWRDTREMWQQGSRQAAAPHPNHA